MMDRTSAGINAPERGAVRAERGKMEGISILGERRTDPIGPGELETIPVSGYVRTIKFETDELAAWCPVTHQPDFYGATIEYEPNSKAVESKALKLYLLGFRDLGIFGEDLAARICKDIFDALDPAWVEVELVQGRRGGLDMTVVARKEERL